MKEKIKEILREEVVKNSIDVIVSRPLQELVIMRGIPGSGKSTKAKTLVREGVIHSTDEVIEAKGDYREFFQKMVESKCFIQLMIAHKTNFKNAHKSMLEGRSPVIIDNTNIKAGEAKKYVMAALEMGYSDSNIKIVDVGTGGLDAQGLSERNTHGVPLDKIEMMMKAHKSVGELTLKKILEAKDMEKPKSDVSYSGIMLDGQSKAAILMHPRLDIPEGWNITKDMHMTICLGPLKDKTDLGKEVILTVKGLGLTDMVMALAVEGYISKNKVPHITVAVNPNGGKPKMSNEITKWVNIKDFNVSGIVTEVKNVK